MKTVIAVTCDRRDGAPATGPNEHGRIRPKLAQVFVNACIVDRLRQAGADVILVPPIDDDATDLVAWLLRTVQGVVLTGGPHDIDPALYGETPEARIDRIDRGRSNLELGLARACWENDRPLLGLCGGEQAMVVALGGSLVQDIGAQLPGSLQHEQGNDPAEPSHAVLLEPGRLRAIYGTDQIQVNSTHHQAAKEVGPLVVTGRAPDGVIEAVEGEDHRFYVGVEWHPELLEGALFQALVDAPR